MMKGYGYRGVLIFLELDYWSCTSSGARSYIHCKSGVFRQHTIQHMCRDSTFSTCVDPPHVYFRTCGGAMCVYFHVCNF